jgi:hypothetical protein
VTHAGLWALACALLGAPLVAGALVALRVATAFTAGVVLLKSSVATGGFLLAPLWDLWAFAVWLAGMRGNTVFWRGLRLTLAPDGRIDFIGNK